LGERQTEDLKVPGSIPGHGTILFFSFFFVFNAYNTSFSCLTHSCLLFLFTIFIPS
jgi:hypothetical protein